jgi:hypothetical protein
MDSEVLNRINAMVLVSREIWTDLYEGAPDIPKNLVIAGMIQSHCKVSNSMAEDMASIIRPHWAQGATGGRSVSPE